MHCKLLWIKVSAKCINVNVVTMNKCMHAVIMNKCMHVVVRLLSLS